MCAPAIRMHPADHHLTSSHGTRPGTGDYRLKQREKIEKGDSVGAFDMDVNDIATNVPAGLAKYGAAIEQARAAIPYTSGYSGSAQCSMFDTTS